MTEDNVADPNSALLQKILREVRESREELRAELAKKAEADEMRTGFARVRVQIDLLRREVDGLRTGIESHDEALRELRDEMRDRRRLRGPTRPKRP
jgi:hypothetical protein